MRNILDRIKGGEIIVADGGIGTMLIDQGMKVGECPENYNLTHPETLSEITRKYYHAGAEILQTNTFGGSPLKLAQYNLDTKVEEINSGAVKIVKGIVGEKAYVSGSCGPSGKILKPYGDTDEEQMHDSFFLQIKSLINSGVDLICIETMTDLTEAQIAVKTAKEINTDIPVIATMTFDATPNGFYTVMGVTVREACQGLSEAGADIIGSNCGNGIENMIKIAGALKNNTSLPVIIQSNAGLPEMVDGRVVYNESPEFMAKKSIKLLEIGVSVIGGCCGTTPEHIRAIKAEVDKFRISGKVN